MSKGPVLGRSARFGHFPRPSGFAVSAHSPSDGEYCDRDHRQGKETEHQVERHATPRIATRRAGPRRHSAFSQSSEYRSDDTPLGNADRSETTGCKISGRQVEGRRYSEAPGRSGARRRTARVARGLPCGPRQPARIAGSGIAGGPPSSRNVGGDRIGRHRAIRPCRRAVTMPSYGLSRGHCSGNGRPRGPSTIRSRMRSRDRPLPGIQGRRSSSSHACPTTSVGCSSRTCGCIRPG